MFPGHARTSTAARRLDTQISALTAGGVVRNWSDQITGPMDRRRRLHSLSDHLCTYQNQPRSHGSGMATEQGA